MSYIQPEVVITTGFNSIPSEVKIVSAAKETDRKDQRALN